MLICYTVQNFTPISILYSCIYVSKDGVLTILLNTFLNVASWRCISCITCLLACLCIEI